jgi:hypothetical protein
MASMLAITVWSCAWVAYGESSEVMALRSFGTLLYYYARAMDITMLASLGTLAAGQSQATAQTLEAMTQPLNYCATHPEDIIEFWASDMVLHVEGNVSYLSKPKG